MTNREKVIVGLMVLTVGYGVIEYTMPRRNAGPPLTAPAEGVNAFIAKVADTIKAASSDASALVIRKAEAAWTQDPFLEIRKPQPARAEAAAPKEAGRGPVSLVYSGFIEIGSRRMAIINGMEYEAGDIVNPGGFTLKSILPAKVLMIATNRDGSPIEVPLQETE